MSSVRMNLFLRLNSSDISSSGDEGCKIYEMSEDSAPSLHYELLLSAVFILFHRTEFIW